MKPARHLGLVAGLALALAHPAWASGGARIPEASSALLFALGVLGVLIGRRIARRQRDGDDRRD